MRSASAGWRFVNESEAHDKYWSGMKPSVDRAIEKRMQGVLKRGPTEKKISENQDVLGPYAIRFAYWLVRSVFH